MYTQKSLKPGLYERSFSWVGFFGVGFFLVGFFGVGYILASFIKRAKRIYLYMGDERKMKDAKSRGSQGKFMSYNKDLKVEIFRLQQCLILKDSALLDLFNFVCFSGKKSIFERSCVHS